MATIWEALERHRQNMVDPDLRNEFLKAFCQFVLSTEEHFYHVNDCLETLSVFTLNIQNNYLQAVLNKLGTQLKTCKDCVDAFHTQVDKYLLKLESHFNSATIKDIESQISSWTVARLSTQLQSYIDMLQSNPQDEKSIRMSAIFVIYELLNYPYLFTSANIDSLFTKFLQSCQTSSKFKLKVSDKIFPGKKFAHEGFVFLICHKSPFVREWALEVISSSTVLLHVDQVKSISPLLKLLYTNITNCSLTAKNRPLMPLTDLSKFATVRSENELWKAFMKIVSIFPRDSSHNFFQASIPELDRMLIQSFLDKVSCCFWERLMLLIDLTQNEELCMWMKTELDSVNGPALFSAISNAPEIQKSGLNERENDGMIFDRFKKSFDWIDSILNILSPFPNWAFDAVTKLWKLSSTWSRPLAYLLHQKLFALEQNCKHLLEFDEFLLLSFFKSGVQPPTIDFAISKKLQYLIKRMIHKDLKVIWNFDFSGTSPLVIHMKFWSIIEDISAYYSQPFQDLIASVSRLFLHGPMLTLEPNKNKFNFVMEQVSKTWSVKIVAMELNWKEILYCCYFNNLTLQSAGHAALLKHTESSTLSEALSVLASLKQAEMLEFLFEVSRLFKQRMYSNCIPHSASAILEHFAALGKIYFPFSGNDLKIAFNLWLNLYMFSISALEGFKIWHTENLVDQSLVKSVVKKIFSEMRSFLEHRNIVRIFVKKDTVTSLFKDWAKENVKNAKLWLIADSVELNFCAAAFLIDLFKALHEEESIEFPISWKETIELECLSVINQNQKESIETYFKPKKRKLVDDSLPESSSVLGISRTLYERASRNYRLDSESVIESKLPISNPPIQFFETSASRLFPATYTKPIIQLATNIKKSSSSSKLSGMKKLKPIVSAIRHSSNHNSQKSIPRATSVKNLGEILGESEDGPELPKEARKIKRLSIPEIRKMGVAISDPALSLVKPESGKNPLVKMKKLIDLILSWSENAVKTSSLIGSPSAVPDCFTDGYNYARIFEPLFFMECRESFRNAYTEHHKNCSYKLILSEVKKVDNRHQISLLMSWDHHKIENWGENAVLILSSSEISVVVLVRKIRNRKAAVVLDCDMKIKPAEASCFRIETEWNAKYLLSMTTQIREYQALSRLNSICLYQNIIKPQRLGRIPFDSLSLNRLMKTLDVNEPQAIAISRASKQLSGFVLIQGPPGTGKTKTILGLIAVLQKKGLEITEPSPTGVYSNGFHRNAKNRLMVCAPSNAAIDEICRRLIAGINNCNGRKYFPKIVRIGKATSIHPDAFVASLEYLIDKKIQENPKLFQVASDNTVMLELQRLISEKKSLREQEGVEGVDLSKEIGVLHSKISEMEKAQVENNSGSKAMYEKTKVKIRNELLLGADIILTTLSGAGHEMLEGVDGLSFETVIIDEACQAVELSTLIPLRFGCRKCILVGDPKQLPPTTLSPYSTKYLYDQSIFQRLQKVSPDSISMLSIQYRMHPHISSFPSSAFYDGLLKDGDGMEQARTNEWHELLPPLKFYNLRGREERNSVQSIFNFDEVSVVLRIVRILAESYPKIPFGNRIGVISFYKVQVTKLKRAFVREFGHGILSMVDINTVDGFQGQEKDIIILSCVRSSNSGSVGFLSDRRRTNVALTRAKFSMIVVGDSDTLCQDSIWQSFVQSAKERELFQSINVSDFKISGANCDNLFSPGAATTSIRAIDRLPE